MQQIQRQYRTIFDDVMKNKEPVFILNKNKAEVVIISVIEFEEMQKKVEQYELAVAREAIRQYKKAKADNKLIKLNSLADLIDEN